MRVGSCLVGLVLIGGCGAACAGDYPIAGVHPERRPDGAPSIREFVRPTGWQERFFFGVAKPVPSSLSWAADQGAWFTPFNRQGMSPPYDIRNWFKK